MDLQSSTAANKARGPLDQKFPDFFQIFPKLKKAKCRFIVENRHKTSLKLLLLTKVNSIDLSFTDDRQLLNQWNYCMTKFTWKSFEWHRNIPVYKLPWKGMLYFPKRVHIGNLLVIWYRMVSHCRGAIETRKTISNFEYFHEHYWEWSNTG